MKANFYLLFRSAGMLSSVALLLVALPNRVSAQKQTDAFPTYDSYIKITGQAADITGDKTAFERRTQQPKDGGVGIEDLHLSKDLSKTTTLTVDGKAMTGSEDYLAQINVTKNEVGSVEVGYKRFRTFYDGVGGFFPLNKQWLPLQNEDLHLDRAKFWAEAKLAMPNAPALTLRYTNELRDGRKDSTIWGDTDLTGLAYNLAPNPVTPARKIVPSYINIGERHQRLEAIAQKTIGKTTIELTLFGDQTNNLDTRYVTRFPGEVVPWSIASLSTTVPTGQVASPQAIAKAAVSAVNWNNQIVQSQSDGSATKTSGVTATSDTVLSDRVSLRLGLNYELVHSDLSGDRPIYTTTPTATGPVVVATDNNLGLLGGARVKDFTGNIALELKPTKNFTATLALRAQDEFARAASSYTVVAASGTPATTLASTPRLQWSKLHQNSETPVLDLRYTGIKDLALYFTGSKRSLNGIDQNTSSYNPLTAAVGTLALNNTSEDHGNYKLGANWKASSIFTLRAEIYRKGHKDDYAGYGSRLGDNYLLDSTDTGYKLTAIVKPTMALSFTTRFVSQLSKMQVTGFLPTFPANDSLDGKNYMLGETIDWTPSTQCYVQLNGNAVFNQINTVYPNAGVTVATATASAWNVNGVVQNSNNNYLSGSALAGFVVDKLTDAQVQVNYYHAANGNAVLAAYTTPYGVAVRDVQATVGLKHKFSDKWIGNAKVGYFDSANDTSGGNLNFHGPVAYVTLEHAL